MSPTDVSVAAENVLLKEENIRLRRLLNATEQNAISEETQEDVVESTIICLESLARNHFDQQDPNWRCCDAIGDNLEATRDRIYTLREQIESLKAQMKRVNKQMDNVRKNMEALITNVSGR